MWLKYQMNTRWEVLGKRAWWLILLTAAAFVLEGCSKREQIPPYPIIDSEFIAADKQVYWLDEDRILFMGHEGEKPRTVEEKNRLNWGLYIWDSRNNTIKRHANLTRSYTFFCYSDGKLLYYLPPQTEDGRQSFYYMYGELGREAKHRVPQKDPNRKTVTNDFTCLNEGGPNDMKGRKWKPLREGHGYLDYGPLNGARWSEQEVRYRRASDGRWVQLPIKRGQLAVIRYIAFRNAYFITKLSGGTQIWAADGCQDAWWLEPSGEVEKVCVPYKPMTLESQVLPGFIPTRKGVIAKGGVFIGAHGQEMRGGMFLLLGEHAQHLIGGHTSGVSVSPSGCKLAFAHAPDLEAIRVGGRGKRTLKVIDVCGQSTEGRTRVSK